MRVYIAGPIHGRPEHNAPVFEEAAIALYRAGHEPVSPLELHGAPEERDAKTRGEIMHTDIRALLECDGVLMLDDWTRSRGARLEREVAIQCGLRVWYRISEVGDGTAT